MYNPKPIQDDVTIVSHAICENCHSEITEVVIMEDTMATDETRSNGNVDESYKAVCLDCAWELYESSEGQWQQM